MAETLRLARRAFRLGGCQQPDLGHDPSRPPAKRVLRPTKGYLDLVFLLPAVQRTC